MPGIKATCMKLYHNDNMKNKMMIKKRQKPNQPKTLPA